MMKAKVLFFISILSSGMAMAATSPVGNWKTIDDVTHEPRAIVQIYEEAGELKGKIIKTFPRPDDKPNCEKCQGELKDKPIMGLVIIWGMKDKGDEWGGGEILDPKNGKVYSAKMEVIEGGAKLKVRGFLGFSLLGRSQVWEKE